MRRSPSRRGSIRSARSSKRKASATWHARPKWSRSVSKVAITPRAARHLWRSASRCLPEREDVSGLPAPVSTRSGFLFRRIFLRKAGTHFPENALAGPLRLSPVPTVRANSRDFDQRALWRKAGRACSRLEPFGGGTTGRLAHRAALFADQKNHEVAVAVIVNASDEGIATLDPMHEAVLAQKIERAINGDRRGAIAGRGIPG